MAVITPTTANSDGSVKRQAFVLFVVPAIPVRDAAWFIVCAKAGHPTPFIISLSFSYLAYSARSVISHIETTSATN